MVCPSCRSVKQAEFTSELIIHSPRLKNIDTSVQSVLASKPDWAVLHSGRDASMRLCKSASVYKRRLLSF